MRDSSYGGPRREIGDCGYAPNIAVYYDGSSPLVPVLRAGVLSFEGGQSFDSGKGIGYNGPSTLGVWSLDIDSILKGGAGTKIRCCNPSLKKKVRFKCCEPNCGENGERVYIELYNESSCEFPMNEEDRWVEPFEVYFQCGCVETCCQKLRKLAALINKNKNSPAVATVVNVGTDWFLELESKIAGKDFRIVGFEGLTPPDVIVPNYQQSFTAKSTKDWFPKEILGACDPNKCLAGLEMWFWDKRPFDEGVGSVTSNPTSEIYPFKLVLTHAIILFDPAIAASNTAFTRLKNILTGTTEYNKVLVSTDCDDFPIYKYCIIRTDAGDEAALEAVRADYTEQIISISRVIHADGKSYYTLTSKSAILPVAPEVVEPAVADVVNTGACGADDLPCNQPDGCPEVEGAGGCVGC
ncbi:hypothetical protein [Dyadobacter sp. CY312]|uniref:hypothetical protein n=1 Tax=Dyadobacter sp. CY312 TaxID=2907303 RepID=UPI001F376F3E|nr:hypothetical protein [Dyadobacter sp. CY312]MCE7039243.1 hypothetical protein [Dyadobacter sp. CY312]